jgi:hypothetical protein
MKLQELKWLNWYIHNTSFEEFSADIMDVENIEPYQEQYLLEKYHQFTSFRLGYFDDEKLQYILDAAWIKYGDE